MNDVIRFVGAAANAEVVVPVVGAPSGCTADGDKKNEGSDWGFPVLTASLHQVPVKLPMLRACRARYDRVAGRAR